MQASRHCLALRHYKHKLAEECKQHMLLNSCNASQWYRVNLCIGPKAWKPVVEGAACLA